MKVIKGFQPLNDISHQMHAAFSIQIVMFTVQMVMLAIYAVFGFLKYYQFAAQFLKMHFYMAFTTHGVVAFQCFLNDSSSRHVNFNSIFSFSEQLIFSSNFQITEIFSGMRKISNRVVTSEAQMKLFECSNFTTANCGLFKLDFSFLLMVSNAIVLHLVDYRIYFFEFVLFQIFSVECVYLVTILQFELILNN